MINIVTDSTSDLGENIAAQHGLTVVSLLVTIGGKTYRDGIDISQKDLFSMVKKNGELPKTSAPSVGEFERVFNIPGDTIFIGISSKLSATVQNARLAAQTMPEGKVRVIDSYNLSSGVGLLALRAADLRSQGASSAQIEAALLESVRKVRTSFVIDTMEYLYKGGRCTGIQAIAGSMLKIHPIIEIRHDGTLGVKENARGSLRKGLQRLLDDFEARSSEYDGGRVYVTTTSMDEQDTEFLVEGIRRITNPLEVRIARAGSVISSHCGPGTTGILYFVK